MPSHAVEAIYYFDIFLVKRFIFGLLRYVPLLFIWEKSLSREHFFELCEFNLIFLLSSFSQFPSAIAPIIHNNTDSSWFLLVQRKTMNKILCAVQNMDAISLGEACRLLSIELTVVWILA